MFAAEAIAEGRHVRLEKHTLGDLPGRLRAIALMPRTQAASARHKDTVTLDNESARRESGARGRRHGGPSGRRRGVEIRCLGRSALSIGRRRDIEIRRFGQSAHSLTSNDAAP